MADQVSRKRISWILLAITAVAFTVTIVGYSYLIASTCGSTSAYEFFSAARAFHTQAGC